MLTDDQCIAMGRSQIIIDQDLKLINNGMNETFELAEKNGKLAIDISAV